ncbi:MAG: hypothetical protein KC449_29145, partial [Anaerolineales bacterium]|nr:hypothetical protein [Anaerolineales bacterium]
DDRLRLIFTCCHPVLSADARVALTLREICGLTTEAIASAFLTTPATLAQRIVRAKAKIREAQIHTKYPHPMSCRIDWKRCSRWFTWCLTRAITPHRAKR